MYRILLVDDEPAILEIGKLLLEEMGDFQVDTLSSAIEALHQLSAVSYDAIVSDYQMPEMDALSFLKELRGTGNYTPFILFTGKGCEEIVIDAFDSGADFYFQKGEDPGSLFIKLSNKLHQIIGQREAEAKILESEERFRRIFESFEDIYFQTDMDGIITLLSPSLYRISGWKEEELVGKPSSLFCEDPAEREEFIQELMKTGYIRNFEIRLLKKDNNPAVTSISGNLLFHPDGTPFGISGSIRDITRQKKTEDELQQKNKELKILVNQLSEEKTLHAASEEKFRKFFEQNSVGFAITSPDGILLHLNQKFCEITGYSYSELKNTSWLDLLFPQNPDDETRLLQSVLQREKPEIEIVKKAVRKDGSLIDVFISIKAIQEPDDSIISMSLTIQDVTTQKNTEERLRKTNVYLENLIASANGPIIVWNPAFQITRVNRACERLIGRSIKDVIGKPLQMLFPPSDQERLMQLIQTTLSGVRWETVEFDIMHRDGSVRTVIWNSSTIFEQDGIKPVATIAQGQDITEQKRLEEEKKKAVEQIQHNFAQLAILNDGIRNPLTVILGLIDLADDPCLIDKITEQVREIDSMVNQLDKRWINSEKILDYLQKHHKIQIDTVPPPDMEQHDNSVFTTETDRFRNGSVH